MAVLTDLAFDDADDSRIERSSLSRLPGICCPACGNFRRVAAGTTQPCRVCDGGVKEDPMDDLTRRVSGYDL